jgi:saccharopine dehydrogenase-like NADP-dependent oxidoreductase
MRGSILIVGGYGEVGARAMRMLRSADRERIVIGGRHPPASSACRTVRIDVDDPASIEAALADVDVVLACVRQRAPHLLRACVRAGLGYTSVAPPRISWTALAPLRAEAEATGARIVLGTGIQPGISSVLARIVADAVGPVESIETALLLGVGDAYGADSLRFLLDELEESYTIRVNGQDASVRAFEQPRPIELPPTFGVRPAWLLPFTDQFYYPHALGARTAVARVTLEPQWLGHAIAKLLRLGTRRRLAAHHGSTAPSARPSDWHQCRIASVDRSSPSKRRPRPEDGSIARRTGRFDDGADVARAQVCRSSVGLTHAA